MVEVALPHRPQARRAVGRAQRRLDHRGAEALGGGGDRRQLQLLLGAEVGEEAALAHPQLGGEAADRQPLQPLDRGEVDGAVEDRGAGLGALGRGWPPLTGYKKARTFVQIA